MLFDSLHEGPTGLAYVCLGTLEAGDAVDYTRSLLGWNGVLHMYLGLARVWAGLKLVLTEWG